MVDFAFDISNPDNLGLKATNSNSGFLVIDELSWPSHV